jgi:hypothetical protein
MDVSQDSLTPRRRNRLGNGLLLGGMLMSGLTQGPASAGRDQRDGPAATEPGAFHEVLGAPGPAEDRSATRDLYGALIGSWRGEVVDHVEGGEDRRQSAEFHFAWVLEGRAVQDLWIVPARSERGAGAVAAGNRYGTTLRVYDPRIDAWRITWINPVTGTETRLVGRRVGSQVVQTGSDADGRLVRWVFVEIRADAFYWRGEGSADGGRTWTCETEFFARRVPEAHGSPPRPGAEPPTVDDGRPEA